LFDRIYILENISNEVMESISKSELKAHALEVFREIEKSGQSRIITDRGRPTLEIRKLRQNLRKSC